MPTKRPPNIMGDEERAAVGREARRASSAIPFEIDPEATPPPSEPPDITSLEGFDSLDPHVQAPLIALHNSQRELDVAMIRLWDARRMPRELERLSLEVKGLMQSTARVEEFTRAVNQHANQLHRVSAWAEGKNKLDDRLAIVIEGLERRLDAVELNQAQFAATVLGAVARIEAAATAAARDQAAADAERKDLEIRLRSLEETRSKTRGAMWAFGLVAAAIGFLAGLVGHYIGGSSSGQK